MTIVLKFDRRTSLPDYVSITQSEGGFIDHGVLDE
jgi:hypothetical protein